MQRSPSAPRISDSSSAERTSRRPKLWATARCVTSSWVGPTPPVVKTRSWPRRSRVEIGGDGVDVVAADHDPLQRDSQLEELGRELSHVGLLDLAGEDLVADDERGRRAGHRAMIQRRRRSADGTARPAAALSSQAVELSILSNARKKGCMIRQAPLFPPRPVALVARRRDAPLVAGGWCAAPAASSDRRRLRARPRAAGRPGGPHRRARQRPALLRPRSNPKPEARAELRLLVDVGSIVEDDTQRGLAHFVEHMAFNGTKRFARHELVDYLEGIGMRFGPDLNAYTGFDETVYMLQVPTDDPRSSSEGLRDPGGLGRRRRVRGRGDRQGARRRHRGVARTARRGRPGAGPAVPGAVQGLALRRAPSDRHASRCSRASRTARSRASTATGTGPTSRPSSPSATSTPPRSSRRSASGSRA